MLKFLTNKQRAFWTNRKIDWAKSYTSTWNHPHRQLIIWALKGFNWISLWEVGVGSGANLVRIVKEPFEGKQLGGSDVNEDAIEECRKTFVGGKFHVEPSEDILLSDKSTDVVLSDACLIYTGPEKIKKTIRELVRVARSRVILCEFHGENLLERWWLRFTTGYNAYNYKKLLEDEGCYDIQLVKITDEFWKGFPWSTWGYLIVAKVSK